MERCKTCSSWSAFSTEAPNMIPGSGACTSARELWNVTKPLDTNESGVEQRELLPEHAGAQCLVADASGHMAVMVTMPDFGCVSHSAYRSA